MYTRTFPKAEKHVKIALGSHAMYAMRGSTNQSTNVDRTS